MPESLFVQTETLSVNGSRANKITLINAGPGILAYKHLEDVSLSDYDGTLMPDSSTVVNRKTWMVSTQEGCRVFAVDEVTYATDMATQKELEDASFEGGGGTPVGPAGGVLAGDYPDPTFSQDMATQTELNAVAAASSTPSGPASGVLAGSYPNPTFAQDMATQAELNAAVLASGSASGPAGGVLSGTYPNPAFAADMATQAELNAAIAGITGGEITVTGADPTGVVDATTILNATYTAVVAQGGGTMRIPPGTYKVSGTGLHMNQNSRVRVVAYGATLVGSGTTPTCITINPGVTGDAGLGAVIEGVRLTNGTAGTGIKFRSCNGFALYNVRIDGGPGADIGILFSNDGSIAGGFNEKHTLKNIYVTSADTGIKWEAVSGGSDSMEAQTFVNVWVGGFTTGYDIGTGISMMSVEHVNCMVQCAGVDGATALWFKGNLDGWKASLVVERLTGANCIITNTDVGCTGNNLADLRIHTLGTFRAQPNEKHASVVLPTIYKDGLDYVMPAILGGYYERVFRDTDTQPRRRSSYAGDDYGPGGATAPDTNIGRLGAGQFGNSTTTKLFGYGLDASDQKITNVAEGVAADDVATVSQLNGGGGGDTSGSVGVALHGNDADFARPTGYGSIEWIGTITPNNAEDGDTFVDVDAGPVFNINNYGADPTGATDSTAAITAAIAALPADGGILYFPAGTYLITPASPAFTLPAATTVLGDGRSNTFLQVEDSPTAVSRIFDIAGGRVEFRHLCFVGAQTPGGVTNNVIGIRHNNTIGIYTSLQNVGSERMNVMLQSFDGVSQTVEITDCYLDGSAIGNVAGEAQENATCLIVPHVGGGLIVRDTTFTGWGSDTTNGSNLDHCIYAKEETPLDVQDCRFLSHYDGRYIQVFGTVAGGSAGVAPPFWGVRNCLFGTPITGNDLIHTNPLRRSLVTGCEFSCSTNQGDHIPAAILPKGDALITNCLFRGGGTGNYTINCTVASKTITLKGCNFADTALYNIFFNANSVSVEVADCDFRSTIGTANIYQGSSVTFVNLIVRSSLFAITAAKAGISTATSGSFLGMTVADSTFGPGGGTYGIRIQAGGTCYGLVTRDNSFNTTNAITKAGTVSSENSRGNNGYLNDASDPVTLGTDWGAGDSYSALNFPIPAAQRMKIEHGTAAAPVTVAGPTMMVSRTDACTNATTVAAGESIAVETTAAIVGVSKNQGAAAQSQVIGVVGEAVTSSTGTGTFNDAGGFFGYAKTNGDGAAAGAYIDGVFGATATPAAFAMGLESRVTNLSGNHTYVPGGPSKTMGCWICSNSGGLYYSACAVQIGGHFDACDVGVGLNEDSCVSAGFRDDSDATVSLDIRGTHSTAINIANGSGPFALNANLMQIGHIGTPGAPGADTVRLYGQRVGGAGTQMRIMALFPSGAAQVVAIEP